jgi:CheY-like chemotaxis protein
MPGDPGGPRPCRPRLVVVEDSYPVAEGLRYLLEALGCDVVGMAGNVPNALELVSSGGYDLVLLDIDLRGEHAAPVAEAVHRQGKPLIFLSGFGEDEVLPPHLRLLPRLEKPADRDQLLAALERALGVSPTG